MAQIVTITNPLTGQPAQVDQLEHTAQQIDDAVSRALPGGALDAAIAGKAPAGFGLGGAGAVCEDCDVALSNGWYYTYSGTANRPFSMSGCFLTLCRNKNETLQIFYPSAYRNTLVMRTLFGGVWGEWEWVNPPLNSGQEYRTTERYQGKPVYVKAVDCGNLPNATAKVVNYADAGVVANVINLYGTENASGNTSTIPSFAPGASVTFHANSTDIILYTETDKTANSAVMTVKYTKTTD